MTNKKFKVNKYFQEFLGRGEIPTLKTKERDLADIYTEFDALLSEMRAEALKPEGEQDYGDLEVRRMALINLCQQYEAKYIHKFNRDGVVSRELITFNTRQDMLKEYTWYGKS